MATTEHFYTGNGSTTSYGFSFPILQNSDLKVALDGVTKTENTSGTNNDYSISNTNVVFNSAPANGVDIHIYRLTDVDTPKATFVSGSSIRAQDLNNNFDQLFYSDQEQHQRVRTVDVRDKAITSDKILDGTIVNADINASAAIDGSKLQASSGSNSGSMSAANFTKLSGIETGATADQTDAEIRTAVGNATNSNVFTDAESTKLSGIETGATADQTASEIRTLVENATDSNVFTDADHTKLNGIETGAEVNVNADWNSSSGDSQILNKPTVPASINDLSDVNTAGVANGKILKYDSSTSKFIIADDANSGGGGGGGSSTFVGLSDTPVAFSGAGGKTVKVNSAGNALEFVTVTTPTQDIVDDTTPQLGGNLDVQTREINTSTTNGNIKVNPNGTGVFEVKGNTNAGTLQLNCENNSHGVKIKSPPHSANASYTLTLPVNDGNSNQVLKTDGSGVLAWVDQTTDTTYSAGSGLTLSGTTFSVNTLNQNTTGTSGGFTAGNASNLNAGTIPDARFPATLPAVSGANLTNLPVPSDNTISAAKLTSNAVTNVKILDDTISEAKLDIHAAPSGTDKVLGYTANGMEWVAAAAGATGGGTDKIFYENGQTVTTNYTITNNTNAMSAGPVAIASGVAVTIGTGENWTIV